MDLASTTGMMVVLRIEMEIIIIRVGLVVAGSQELCFGHVKIENPSVIDIEMSSKRH